METYYQESGRAGRDGLPSECILFFRPADVPRQSSMVFYENSGLQNLYDIVRYCQSKRQCRRSAIFHHFAEPLQDCDGMCDNCAFSSDIKEVDASGHAKIVVSLLQDMRENDQRLTMLQLVDRIKNKHKEVGLDLKREELEQLVVQLIVDHVLKEEFRHTAYATNAYVTVGPLAKQLLLGKKIIKLEISSSRKNSASNKKSKRGLTFCGLELKLDELRKELCSVNGGILPHSVFSSQQISMLSSQKPKSMEELEGIIGKLKTEKYGVRILEEIEKWPADNDTVYGSLVSGNTSTKKLKTQKSPVLIESSEDEV